MRCTANPLKSGQKKVSRRNRRGFRSVTHKESGSNDCVETNNSPRRSAALPNSGKFELMLRSPEHQLPRHVCVLAELRTAIRACVQDSGLRKRTSEGVFQTRDTSVALTEKIANFARFLFEPALGLTAEIRESFFKASPLFYFSPFLCRL